MPPKVEAEGEAAAAGAGDEGGDEEKKSTGCCCCKGKIAPDGPVKVDPAFWTNTGCKDFSFCILFIAFWVGMIIVLILAANNGNGNGVQSLAYGKDWQGTTCGVNNAVDTAEPPKFGAQDLRTKGVLYFPLDGQNYDPNQKAEDISLYGVCTNECPAALGKYENDCSCLATIKDKGFGGTDVSCPAVSGRTITAGNEAACTTGTWDYPSGALTPGVKDTALAKVCLTANGVLFGTVAPSAGYAQFGISHDCICEYNDNRCWEIDYPTKEVMYRCIPCEDPSTPDCVPASQYQTKCVDPAPAAPATALSIEDADCVAAGQTWCIGGGGACCSTACVSNVCPASNYVGENSGTTYPVPGDVTCVAGSYKYLLTTVETQSQPDNAIGDVVSGGFATVIAYVNDLFSCLTIIAVIGLVFAMAGSWVWVLFLKYFAKPLVWISIISVLVGLAILTFVGLCKSGQLSESADLIRAYAAVGGSNVTAYGIPLASEGEAWIFKLMWAFGGILFFVCFMGLCMKQKQIRQATAVLKEASNALQDMPLMIAFPFIPFVLCVLFFFYFMIGTAYIWTADQISMSDLNAAVVETAGTTNGMPTTVDKDESVLFYMFWYHLLGFLWANQLVQAISMCTISGAYSFWYFYGRVEERKPEVAHAFIRSLKRVLRYHIGSMAFGALLVALVQLARAILAYVDKQTKTWQDKSKLLKVAFKVVACCLWCFEKAMKFITRNAYIFIAINGKPFCTSAKHAFWSIIKNLFLVGFVNLVSVVLILLGKLIITVGCGVIAYIYIESSPSFTYKQSEVVTCVNPATGEDMLDCDKIVLLQSPVVPVIFTMMMAWVIASMFFYIYELGVDTLLMCFIEEKTILDAATKQGRAVEFSGPKSLVKFMDGHKKGAKSEKDAEKDAERETEEM